MLFLHTDYHIVKKEPRDNDSAGPLNALLQLPEMWLLRVTEVSFYLGVLRIINNEMEPVIGGSW